MPGPDLLVTFNNAVTMIHYVQSDDRSVAVCGVKLSHPRAYYNSLTMFTRRCKRCVKQLSERVW